MQHRRDLTLPQCLFPLVLRTEITNFLASFPDQKGRNQLEEVKEAKLNIGGNHSCQRGNDTSHSSENKGFYLAATSYPMLNNST